LRRVRGARARLEAAPIEKAMEGATLRRLRCGAAATERAFVAANRAPPPGAKAEAPAARLSVTRICKVAVEQRHEVSKIWICATKIII